MTDKEENQSIIGLRIEDEKAYKETVHRSGEHELESLETDDFHDMAPEDRPHDMAPQTGPLTEKVRGGLTRLQHINRSLAVEAALIKCFSGRIPETMTETQLRAVMSEILRSVGGEWAEYVDLIRR